MAATPTFANRDSEASSSLAPREARDMLIDCLTSAQFARMAPASAPIHHAIGEREVRATVVETVRLLFGGLGLEWGSPTRQCLVTAIRYLASHPQEWGLADPAAAEQMAEILNIAKDLDRPSQTWDN